MGGAKPRTTPPTAPHPNRPCRTSVTPTLSVVPAPLPPSVIPTPPPSHPLSFVIPARRSVIPAQAGTKLYPHPRPSFPNSSLPPLSRPSHNPRIRRCKPIRPIWSGCRRPAKFGVVRRSALRGEVRWGVRSHEPPHQPRPARSPMPHPRRTSTPQRASRLPATKPYPTAPANVTEARGRRAAACLRDAMTALIRLMSPEGGV